MENTVSFMTMAIICFNLVLGVAVPVGLLIVFRKKFKCNIGPFFIGCAVMLIFVFVLENMMHTAILTSPAGSVIQNNILLYGIYGGFMAGLFEEGGRYLAFRFILKKQQENNYNALMYGAGHGGFEMFVLLFTTMLNNLIYSVMINTGTMNDILTLLPEVQQEAMGTVVEQLTQVSPGMFLLSPVERIAALVLQISLSVLVWFAAKNKKNILLLPLAGLLHMLVDSVVGAASTLGLNVIVIEVFLYVIAGCSVWIAVRVWRKQSKIIS